MKMTEALIEFKNVVKGFGDKIIIDGLSFAVYPGETLCIIGGSGTGKSVTLKLLLGLLPIDAGEILYRGKSLEKMTERELNKMRSEVGMVFQGSALFDSLTVYENVAYPLEEKLKYDENEIERLVMEKLQLVGLADAADLYPADISGGMKKRIGLARALATNPHTILYDEPTAGLDPTNVNRIDHLIQHLQKVMGVTSVVVTHHMPSVYLIANRVALLFNKKLVFCDTLDKFKISNNEIVREFVEGRIGE